MNILSFDIEEWYLRQKKFGANTNYADLDKVLNILLAQLQQTQQKATFFCLGQMAIHFPHIIQLIASQGHEIACHSNEHFWCNKISKQELAEDTHRAIDSLQQCIGKKIRGYRAPAFSIGEKNLYAFDILAQNGIEYDASVFPATRDFGGYPSFGLSMPTLIRTNNHILKEFPIPITSMCGHKMAFSGGGYFRLLPYWYVSSLIKRNDYVMTYFHIGDLLSTPKQLMSKEAYEAYFKEQGTLSNRWKRYIKSNIGTGDALSKLTRLINEKRFINIEQAEKLIDWNQVPTKKI